MANDQNLNTQIIGTTIDIQPASFTILNAAPVDSVNGLIGDVVLTTSEITEGTNLYYTEARVDANIAGKTTTDLAEGANLYYTDARVEAKMLAGVPDIHADQLQLTGMPEHMTWNADDGTVNIPLNANVTLQVGQEETHLVRNNSGVVLNNGDVVRVTGAQGDRLTVEKASNLNESLSSSTIGVMTETVGVNGTGYMTVSGLVRDLNTLAYPEGSAIWLGNDGQFQTSKPLTPAHLVLVGYVVRQHQSVGSIFVRVVNGLEMEELHDVLVTNAQGGDLLAWDAINGYWKNQNLAALDIATKTYVDSQNHFDGQYSSLTGAPTNVSAFTNDAGYLTSYTETDPLFTASPAAGITGINITNWNTAYGWGDHSLAGYLTSYTETDPTVPAHVKAISTTNINNWNTAFSWGDHGTQGYLTSVALNDVSDVLLTSPSVNQVLQYNGFQWVNSVLDYSEISNAPTNVSAFTNDAGYLTSYTETDPVFTASPAGGITAPDITNWNTAYGWGNHATAGYLSSVALNDVTDVVITTPSTNDLLSYDGANWVNTVREGLLDGTTISANRLIADAGITNPGWAQYGGANPSTIAKMSLINNSFSYAFGRRTTGGGLQHVGTQFAFFDKNNTDPANWNGNGLLKTSLISDQVSLYFLGDESNKVENVTTLGGNLDSFDGVTEFGVYDKLAGNNAPVKSVPLRLRSGGAELNGTTTINGSITADSVTTSIVQPALGNTLELKTDSGNVMLGMTQNGISSPETYGGRFNFETTGNDTGDIMGIALRTTGNDKAILFNAHGDILMDGGQGGTDITHGVTMWGHGYLGLTIDRDIMYTGKPFQFVEIPVGPTAPVSPVEGVHWLDTSAGAGLEVLKTYRGAAWIQVYDEKNGLTFYDSTNHRLITRENGSWRALPATVAL